MLRRWTIIDSCEHFFNQLMLQRVMIFVGWWWLWSHNNQLKGKSIQKNHTNVCTSITFWLHRMFLASFWLWYWWYGLCQTSFGRFFHLWFWFKFHPSSSILHPSLSRFLRDFISQQLTDWVPSFVIGILLEPIRHSLCQSSKTKRSKTRISYSLNRKASVCLETFRKIPVSGSVELEILNFEFGLEITSSFLYEYPKSHQFTTYRGSRRHVDGLKT